MFLGLVESAILVTGVLLVTALAIVVGVCYFQERAAQKRKHERNEIRRKHLEYLHKYNA